MLDKIAIIDIQTMGKINYIKHKLAIIDNQAKNKVNYIKHKYSIIFIHTNIYNNVFNKSTLVMYSCFILQIHTKYVSQVKLL